MPLCPRGHTGSRVVLGGFYGRVTRRQMYKCYPAGPEAPHRFAPLLPWLTTASGVSYTRAADTVRLALFVQDAAAAMARSTHDGLAFVGKGRALNNVKEWPLSWKRSQC